MNAQEVLFYIFIGTLIGAILVIVVAGAVWVVISIGTGIAEQKFQEYEEIEHLDKTNQNLSKYQSKLDNNEKTS